MVTERPALTAATWSRLQTFLAVVDRGSVGSAAAALHVTPPAVSAAVSALEKELGATLFTKDGRGIRTTAAGTTFAHYARSMLGLLDEARSAVADAEKSTLRLGAVATASETVLPTLMASFVRSHPSVTLSLSVRPRDELFDELAHHELDVVLAGRPPRGSGLVTRGQRDNSLVLVGSPAWDCDPRTTTWLLRDAGSGTRETTDALLARLRPSPPVLTLGTQGAVIAAALVGLGVTLVHRDAVASQLVAGDLHEVTLTGTPLSRPWHLTTTHHPTAATTLFVRHVADEDQVGAEAFHLRNRPAG